MRMSGNQKRYIALGLVAFIGISGGTAFSLLRAQETPVVQKAETALQEEKKSKATFEQEAESVEEAIDTQADTYPQGKDEEEKFPEETSSTEHKEKKEETKQETQNSPIKTEQYIVQENDTLFLIAQRAGLTVDKLKANNKLKSDTIVKGQVLTIKPSEKLPDKSEQETASRGDREEDLYWLSRIIHAEAQGETYEGKVAVGNVILNRVKSSLFPNTIKGVVFDKQQGYTQFSPVLDGSIYNTPNSDSINAAKDVLNGKRPVGNALYFLNPDKSTNFWITKNRKYYKTIGDHDFYY